MTTTDTARVALTQTVEGDWALPCGCLFHLFEGKPVSREVLSAADLTPTGETHLVGVVAPHVHLCFAHRPKAKRSAA